MRTMSNNLLDKKIEQETFELDGEVYTFAELLTIDPTNINAAFSTQSSRYAFVGAMAAKAEALYDEAKTKRERIYAEVELNYREELAGDNTIKVTEGLIRSYVASDSTYLKVLQMESNALRDWKLLRALTDALRQRGELLIGMAANLRQEFEYQNMALKSRLRNE